MENLGYIKSTRTGIKLHGMQAALVTTLCGKRILLGPGDKAIIRVTKGPIFPDCYNIITVESTKSDTRIRINNIKKGDVVEIRMADFREYDEQVDVAVEAVPPPLVINTV